MDKGFLYLVATPIGNLDDISFRAIKTLEQADYILCEDTRHSIKLLNHYEISKKLVSYHEYNQYKKADSIINDLNNGMQVALITDAGTPGISDPGSYLVEKCQENDIDYTVIPGPSALINALILSGQNTNRFIFEGFLPTKNKEIKKRLELLKKETRTIIIYEAPHRLKKTLKELLEVLGENRSISLVREITKKFEEVKKLTINEAYEFACNNEIKGEHVLVIEGISQEELDSENAKKYEDLSFEDQMEQYLNEGLSKKDAIKKIAKVRNLNKREVYMHFTK